MQFSTWLLKCSEGQKKNVAKAKGKKKNANNCSNYSFRPYQLGDGRRQTYIDERNKPSVPITINGLNLSIKE